MVAAEFKTGSVKLLV